MSYVKFAAICDHCGRRSEEYNNWAHCRECATHACDKCRTDYDEESGECLCRDCAFLNALADDVNNAVATLAKRYP